MTTVDAYRRTIRELSDRMVEVQRPIKVLSAINWDDSVKEAFFASGFKQQPPVDRAYYEKRPMKLDPAATRAELRSLEADILGGLGPIAPAGVLMRFMCEQFRLVVELLEARGTDQFSAISNLLCGTAHDVFHAGGPNIADLAAQMRHVLDGMAVQTSGAKDERVILGSDAVGILQAQLDDSMARA